MESNNRGEESGEMYSPDKHGEYAPEATMPEGVLWSSVQALMDALTREVPNMQLLSSVTSSMSKWMGLGLPTYSSLTSRANAGLHTRPLKLCRHTWERCLSCFAHFAVNPLPPCVGVVPCSSGLRHWHRLQAKDHGPAIPTLTSNGSDSAPQLVGSAPFSTVNIGSVEDNTGNKSA